LEPNWEANQEGVSRVIRNWEAIIGSKIGLQLYSDSHFGHGFLVPNWLFHFPRFYLPKNLREFTKQIEPKKRLQAK